MAVYRPMLKTKKGETDALSNLTSEASGKTHPIFVMVPSPPQKFGEKLASSWGGLPVAMHGDYNAQANGTTQYFVDSFNEAGENGVPIIPAFSVNDDQCYIDEAGKLFNKYGPGSVVVASFTDLNTVGSWVDRQGWPKNEIDLVIDLHDISQVPEGILETSVPPALQSNISNPPGWRSVTLSGFSAPLDFGSVQGPRTELYRLEWLLWQSVSKKLPWTLDYGDKGPTSPVLDDPPGEAMAKATVSVRYTAEDRWILLKGNPTTGKNGRPMSDQYLEHANNLVSDANFNKLDFCWADDYIREIANGNYSTGNRPIWASIMINRHLELVGNKIP